jgi:hypothetical protein
VERDVIVPSFMCVALHGKPCESRSVEIGGERYERIANQREYESYIQALRESGMEELRYGIQGNAVKLIPTGIRNPRPLQREP